MASEQLYLGGIKTIARFCADALFPRFCVRCKKEGSLLCDKCFVEWTPALVEHVCRVCLVPSAFGATCKRCTSTGTPDLVQHQFQYADPVVRELIQSWKYHFDQTGWEHLRKHLSLGLPVLKRTIELYDVEAITPLPLYYQRRCERGFDQSELLARYLSKECRIEFAEFLKRTRGTGKQADRSTDARKKEMMLNPFVSSSTVPKSVLLVDDVWTTGATASAATAALKKRGVETVFVYTLAKG